MANLLGYSAYEDKDWILKLCDYVRWIYEEHPSKKIIGICFGHQIIALALGGTVDLNPKGWEIAVREVQLSDRGKEIFDLNDVVIVSGCICFITNISDYNKCIGTL